MCKWIKNKFGEEFQFGILDKVVLEVMEEDTLQRNPGSSSSSYDQSALMVEPGNNEDKSQDEIVEVQGEGLSEGNSVTSTFDKQDSTSKNKIKNRTKTKNDMSASAEGLKLGLQRGKKQAKSIDQQLSDQHATASLPKKYKFDHKGRKYYSCTWSHCKERFKSNDRLTYHLNRHKDIRPYFCTWNNCTKSFYSEPNLYMHMQTHTSERKFKCDASNCSKTFTRRYNLTKDKRVHTGEKPYLCHFCNHSFANSSTLHVHILKLHTNERSVKCERCNKTFATVGDLTQHKKKCHT